MSPKQPRKRASDHPETDTNQNGSGSIPTGTVVDRRLGLNRRDSNDSNDAQNATGLERRRGRGRRLSDFTKSAEEGEMNTEQFLFLMAIEAFKKSNDRMFPTWSDVLEVVRLLGYRKTQSMEITLDNADDWTEAADAPSNVRPDRWAERFTKTERQTIAPSPSQKGPEDYNAVDDAFDALDAMEDAFGDYDSDDADSDSADFEDAA